MTFTINNLTKFYWVLLLIGATFILFAMESSDGRLFMGLIFLLLIALAIRSMSYKVHIKGRKITKKTLFTERSINIFPESRIYITKNITSLYILYRHYNYAIKIINPNETLNINANVNDADVLYELIAELEQKIILPVWFERFSKQQSLKMDSHLSINNKGITYKNKDYPYESLSSIELEQGYFRLKADGKLWQTSVLALPVSAIPNLTTFMTLIQQNQQ